MHARLLPPAVPAAVLVPATASPASARHRAAQRGQGMTEYIIIVALIAVAAIAVYQFFGQTIRNQTAGIAKEVSGQSADSAINQAKSAADSAESEGSKKKGLSSYQNNESR